MDYATSVLFCGIAIVVWRIHHGCREPICEWSVERLNHNATALSNRDTRLLGDKVLTAELGFICNRESKSFGASLIPFEGSYKTQQHDVPVLVQKSADNITDSDLSQKWQNGFKYLFLNDQDEIGKVVTYLKTSEYNGIDFVHFFFSGDFNRQPDVLNHVVISLSGFSEGFATLNKTCKR